MRAEERVLSRDATYRGCPVHPVGSGQGQPGPTQNSSHHWRRCVPRPVWPREAVARVAVQVGHSSSSRHISPTEKRQPVLHLPMRPHLFGLARGSEPSCSPSADWWPLVVVKLPGHTPRAYTITHCSGACCRAQVRMANKRRILQSPWRHARKARRMGESRPRCVAPASGVPTVSLCRQ
jgi:hypothetical protein